MKKIKCNYCQQEAILVNGDIVYPHRPDLYNKKIWLCSPCKAWVGTHQGTDKPLGRLAKEDLRILKRKVHAAFDPLWKSRKMSRKSAYTWLAKELGISKDECHIGMFDEDRCKEAIRKLKKTPSKEGACPCGTCCLPFLG